MQGIKLSAPSHVYSPSLSSSEPVSQCSLQESNRLRAKNSLHRYLNPSEDASEPMSPITNFHISNHIAYDELIEKLIECYLPYNMDANLDPDFDNFTFSSRNTDSLGSISPTNEHSSNPRFSIFSESSSQYTEMSSIVNLSAMFPSHLSGEWISVTIPSPELGIDGGEIWNRATDFAKEAQRDEKVLAIPARGAPSETETTQSYLLNETNLFSDDLAASSSSTTNPLKSPREQALVDLNRISESLNDHYNYAQILQRQLEKKMDSLGDCMLESGGKTQGSELEREKQLLPSAIMERSSSMRHRLRSISSTSRSEIFPLLEKAPELWYMLGKSPHKHNNPDFFVTSSVPKLKQPAKNCDMNRFYHTCQEELLSSPRPFYYPNYRYSLPKNGSEHNRNTITESRTSSSTSPYALSMSADRSHQVKDEVRSSSSLQRSRSLSNSSGWNSTKEDRQWAEEGSCGTDNDCQIIHCRTRNNEVDSGLDPIFFAQLSGDSSKVKKMGQSSSQLIDITTRTAKKLKKKSYKKEKQRRRSLMTSDERVKAGIQNAQKSVNFCFKKLFYRVIFYYSKRDVVFQRKKKKNGFILRKRVRFNEVVLIKKVSNGDYTSTKNEGKSGPKDEQYLIKLEKLWMREYEAHLSKLEAGYRESMARLSNRGLSRVADLAGKLILAYKERLDELEREASECETTKQKIDNWSGRYRFRFAKEFANTLMHYVRTEQSRREIFKRKLSLKKVFQKSDEASFRSVVRSVDSFFWSGFVI